MIDYFLATLHWSAMWNTGQIICYNMLLPNYTTNLMKCFKMIMDKKLLAEGYPMRLIRPKKIVAFPLARKNLGRLWLAYTEMVLISIFPKDVGLLWYHQMLKRIMGNYHLKLPYILTVECDKLLNQFLKWVWRIAGVVICFVWAEHPW